MRLRTMATIAAITSTMFGIAGLAAPGPLGSALIGTDLDSTASMLVRLACAAYLGYGILAWLSRDLTDPAAGRAIAAANTAAWGLSAVVATIAVLSGLGLAQAWIVVAMQVAFAGAWASVMTGTRTAVAQAA